jgi:8-oxo-dGTP diphosphatase
MAGLETSQPDVLVVDADVPRTSQGDRPVRNVAVGVLMRPNGDFLLTSRPPGKPYAGFWEFPGGKVEEGETAEQALARELFEELGIQATAVQPWRELLADYPHAMVRLFFFRVTAWAGELTMQEGQACAWQRFPVQVGPVLAGTVPVLEWLKKDSI